MARTEVLMLVGLGFVLSLLLVMAFGRSIWSLSNSYAKRQRDNDLPAAMLSLQADRDRLRAEHAAMTRRLEAINESAKAAIASQIAEVTRHRNRVVGLTENINEKSVELSAKSEVVVGLNVQLQELADTLDLQQRAARELTADIVEKDATILRLESEIAGLSNKIADGQTDLSRLTMQLQEALAETSALKQEMAEAIAMNSRVERPSPDIIQDNFQTETETADIVSPFEEPPVKDDTVQSKVQKLETSGLHRPGRYNFDRPSAIHLKRNPPPQVQQPDIKEVLKEARRDLIDLANASQSVENGLGTKRPADGVISLAKRLRALQTKSDEKLTKTLK